MNPFSNVNRPPYKHCAFCDAVLLSGDKRVDANETREDIVPVWLQQHLGITKRTIKPALFNVDGSMVPGTERAHRYNRLRTRGICRKCNNGWDERFGVGSRSDNHRIDYEG